jgi:hypothetical protein
VVLAGADAPECLLQALGLPERVLDPGLLAVGPARAEFLDRDDPGFAALDLLGD